MTTGSRSGVRPPRARRGSWSHPIVRFFVPPYVGQRGWLGVFLDVEVDWDEIAELIDAAYRVVAPKTLVAEIDALGGKCGDRPS